MKNIKRLIAVVVSACVVSAAGIAYAADIKTPADIAAAVTGKSATDISNERAEGKTYVTIANEAGKLDEFKTQMLEQKKALLDQKVKDGKITQQQADEIYNAIKNNQVICDGTGNARLGKQFGMGCGNGQGMGNGRGQGQGMRRGSCNK
jgi:hypothetical protein